MVPFGKIGLGCLPYSLSNPLRLRIIFMDYLPLHKPPGTSPPIGPFTFECKSLLCSSI